MAEQPAWATAMEACGALAAAIAAALKFRRARNVADSETIRLFRRELMEIKRDVSDMNHRFGTLTERLDTIHADTKENERKIAELASTVRADLISIQTQFAGATLRIGKLVERLARE